MADEDDFFEMRHSALRKLDFLRRFYPFDRGI
jgi:hypothetical protein